jgi:hypothetical protein
VKRRVFVAVAAGLMAGACGRETGRAAAAPQQVVAWKSVGSWSGRGNKQTESFTSGSGALRIHWTTTLADPPSGTTGGFRVTAHSAISGRLLEQVVDHQGAGGGIGYVNQDPHVFYLMVESDHVNWTLSVDEAIAGTVTDSPR